MSDHNLDELQAWCNEARRILGRSARNAMQKRSDEAHDLLVSIRGLLQKYPELAQPFAKLKKDYEELALSAKAMESGKLKKLDSREKKKRMLEISQELNTLKAEVRLALGTVAPNATPEVRKAVLLAEHHRPVYLDKRRRIGDAIEELAALPATDKQVQNLRNLLNSGRNAEPDYEAAYKALTGLHTNLEAGQKAAAEYAKNAGGKEFQLKLAQARKSLDNLAEVVGIAEATYIASERARTDALIRKIAEAEQNDITSKHPDGRHKKQAMIDANGVLDKLINDVDKKAKESVELAKTVKELADKVSELLETIVECAPAYVLAPLNSRAYSAQALAGSQQLKAAEQAYKALHTDAKKVSTEHQAYFDTWDKTDQDLRINHEPVLNAALVIPSVRTIANQVLTTINMDTRAKLLPLNEFKKANELVQEKVIAEMEMFKKAVEAHKMGQSCDIKFQAEEYNARANLAKAKETISEQETALQSELNKLAEKEGFVDEFKAEIAIVWQDWDAYELDVIREATTSVKDQDSSETGKKYLDQLDAKAKAAVKILKDLKDRVVEILGDEELLEKSKASQSNANTGREFDAARQLTEKAMKYIEEFGLPLDHRLMAMQPAVKGMQAQLAELIDDAERNKKYAVDRMNKLAEDIENKGATIESEVKKCHVMAQKKAAEIRKTLTVLRKKKENKAYDSYFDVLDDKVTDCMGMATSTIMSVVLKGQELLDELEKEIGRLKVQFESPDGENYKTVKAKLDELTSRVKASELKEYQKVSQTVLQMRLASDLPDRLHGKSPKEALDELKKFEQELKESEDLAAAAKREHDNVVETATKVSSKLSGISKSDAPELYSSLEARIKAVENMPKGEEQRALAELDAVALLIHDATTSNDKRDALEKKVKRDVFEAEREKAAFQAAKDVFDKNAKRNAEAAKKATPARQRNDDVFQQMESVYNEAAKLAKTGNYQAAREKLHQAISLAEYFAANPFDAATTARKELVSLNKKWKEAVSQYLKERNDLADTIRAKGKSETDVDEAKAVQILEPLASLFDASIFDGPVELLSTEMTEIKELRRRRQQKETALFHLRRFERMLDSQVVLQHVIGNPINNLSDTDLRNVLRSFVGALLAA